MDDLKQCMVDKIKYHKMEETEMWRIGLINELINIKHGDLNLLEGWTHDDLEVIMDFTLVKM